MGPQMDGELIKTTHVLLVVEDTGGLLDLLGHLRTYLMVLDV